MTAKGRWRPEADVNYPARISENKKDRGRSMNWETISAISEAVGAVAIVATLIYLAIQIRQNTASVKGSAYQQWVAANLELNVAATEPTLSQVLILGATTIPRI